MTTKNQRNLMEEVVLRQLARNENVVFTLSEIQAFRDVENKKAWRNEHPFWVKNTILRLRNKGKVEHVRCLVGAGWTADNA